MENTIENFKNNNIIPLSEQTYKKMNSILNIV